MDIRHVLDRNLVLVLVLPRALVSVNRYLTFESAALDLVVLGKLFGILDVHDQFSQDKISTFTDISTCYISRGYDVLSVASGEP